MFFLQTLTLSTAVLTFPCSRSRTQVPMDPSGLLLSLQLSVARQVESQALLLPLARVRTRIRLIKVLRRQQSGSRISNSEMVL